MLLPGVIRECWDTHVEQSLQRIYDQLDEHLGDDD